MGKNQSEIRENEKLIEKPEDILSVQQKGDTLFIDVKALPSQSGPFDSYTAVFGDTFKYNSIDKNPCR